MFQAWQPVSGSECCKIYCSSALLPQLHAWQVTSFEGLGVGLGFPPPCSPSMQATKPTAFTLQTSPWGLYYQGVSLEERDVPVYSFSTLTHAGHLPGHFSADVCLTGHTHDWSKLMIAGLQGWAIGDGEHGRVLSTSEYQQCLWVRAAEHHKESSARAHGDVRGNTGEWKTTQELHVCICMDGGKNTHGHTGVELEVWQSTKVRMCTVKQGERTRRWVQGGACDLIYRQQSCTSHGSGCFSISSLTFRGLQFRVSLLSAVPSVAWCLHPCSLLQVCNKTPFGRWDKRRDLINGENLWRLVSNTPGKLQKGSEAAVWWCGP